MANYREIKGFTIQTFSSDPSNPIDGQVWYNSTLGKVRVYKQTAGAWSTAPNCNSGRNFQATMGTQTAGLQTGGYHDPGVTSDSEEYNGTAWAEGDNLNTARSSFRGCGTQTAGLVACGWKQPGNSDDVEEYDGTSWTEQSNRPPAAFSNAMAGVQTAALCIGGYTSGNPGMLADVDEYNGSSWTAITNLPAARSKATGIGGTSTAVLSLDGNPGPPYVDTNEWNGTSWTAGGNLPANWGTTLGAGTQTAGFSVKNTNTCTYDGSSWTELAAQLNNSRSPGDEGDGSTNGSATATSYWCGGDPKPVQCEDFDDPSTVTASIDTT